MLSSEENVVMVMIIHRWSWGSPDAEALDQRKMMSMLAEDMTQAYFRHENF